jgi:hypothetical protein
MGASGSATRFFAEAAPGDPVYMETRLIPLVLGEDRG